jgi:hypothetical protein
MTRRFNGGVRGKLPTVTASSASGMWDLLSVHAEKGASNWPSMAPPALWTGSLILNGVAGSSGRAYPGTQAEYAGTATIPATSNYAFSSGYHFFDISAGTYSVSIKGAEGSGTQHGYGADISATLIVVQQTRMVALIGNAANGNYSGGGGTFLAITSGNVYTTATALLVAGGGGGGYTATHNEIDAGGTSWTPTTRRGLSTDRGDGRGGTYDGGAAFSNVYNPEIYASTEGGQGSTAAQHFVWGGRGGITTACSGSQQGGFGGGGGSCPAGGGGYYGGKAGGNSPGQYGGGGGTSYRLSSGSTAYISAWSDVGTNGSSRTSNPGTVYGSLSITRTGI